MNIYECEQDVLFSLGVALASDFLSNNQIPLPTFSSGSLYTVRAPSGSYGCGVYLPRLRTIRVNPYACAKPARGTPRKFSFPGNTTDRTPVGVVAHETGHYLDDLLTLPSNTDAWRRAMRGSKITSYEPNPSEAFAESVRLFITNPALLGAFAAPRFRFLANELGIKMRTEAQADPLATLRAWGASEAILNSASNKCRGRH